MQRTALKLRGEFGVFLALGLALGAYYLSPWLGLTALAAFAFGLLAWLRLDLALLYVVITMPFYRFPKLFPPSTLALDQLMGRSTPLAFSLAEFTVLVCLLASVARTLFSPNSGRDAARIPALRAYWRNWTHPALLPVLVFLVAATVSLWTSRYPSYSLREFRVVIVEPFLFLLMLLSVVRSPKEANRFLHAFVFLGAAVALLGISHYFLVGEVEATGGVRRILAVYHSPNALALFLGRVLPIPLALVLLSQGRGGLLRRWAYSGAAFLMLLGLYLTFSRGAWIGVGAALLFLTLAAGPRRALPLLVAAFGLLLVALPFLPWERFLSSAPVLQRWYVWQAAFAIILDHPLTGVGLDNFLYLYPQYMLPQAWAEPNVSHPHNLVLDFWTRLGILGVASLVALQVTFWRTGTKLLQSSMRSEQGAAILSLMASMVDFLVHGLIDNSFFLIDLAYIFWLTYGLVVALDRIRAEATASAEGVT